MVPVVPEGPVSAIPLEIFLAFGVPVFFVVLWFMVRLFSGRWITDPSTLPTPVESDQHVLDER